jgi:N utilization substance protein A
VLLTEEIANEEQLEQVSGDLLGLEGMDKPLAAKLAAEGIKTLDDFAELSAGELIDIAGDLDEEKAKSMILKAREHWFE